MTNVPIIDIYLDNKITKFEEKLSTYIDIYNIKYGQEEDQEKDFLNSANKTAFQKSRTKTAFQKIPDKTEDLENPDKTEDLENPEHTHITDNLIRYEGLNPKLERIGNIEILYKNFINTNKKIVKHLRYLIYKLDILLIIETCHCILNNKGFVFDFINYNYDLYNVIGCKNIYVIHQKLKYLQLKFEVPCIIYILIRDKLFIHYY